MAGTERIELTTNKVRAAEELMNLALTAIVMHDDPGCSEDAFDVHMNDIREWRVKYGDVEHIRDIDVDRLRNRAIEATGATPESIAAGFIHRRKGPDDEATPVMGEWSTDVVGHERPEPIEAGQGNPDAQR